MSEETIRPDEEPDEAADAGAADAASSEPDAVEPDLSESADSESDTAEDPGSPVEENSTPEPDESAVGAETGESVGEVAGGGTGSTPAWVPAAVVAGVVLLVEAFIVLQIRPEGTGDTPNFIGDLATVSSLVGGVSLLTGYFFFLRSRTSLAGAFEAFALSGLTVVLYGMCWRTLIGALTLNSETLFFVEPLELTGKMANVAGIVGLVCFVLGFAWSFQQTAKLVWPFFRRGVALNVLAMLHLVILLLGFVSALNMKYTARKIGTGIDLTETNEFTLSDPTKDLLADVKGDLDILLLDMGGLRGKPSSVTSKTRDLLQSFEAAGSTVNFRTLDLFKDPEGSIKVLQELGMESVRDALTGEVDVVAIAYRVPGERLPSRTKVVRVDHEFTDVSALGNDRFRGESILMNVVKEVVFVQRRVYFTVGHGEKPLLGAPTPATSFTEFSQSMRRDNFAVGTLDFKTTSSVPEDADLVVVPGPTTAFLPVEAEALREFLGRGGSVILMLEPQPDPSKRRTGLEDLLAAWGLVARNDTLAVTYLTERMVRGPVTSAQTSILVGKQEYGRHSAMAALSDRDFTLVFQHATVILAADEPVKDVRTDFLVAAPREVDRHKPFGLVLRPGRSELRPEPGDITDRRITVGMAAERSVAGDESAGGRLVVIGDTDFATDLHIGRNSVHRTFLLNIVNWAVRRDLQEIDARTLENEMVSLRPIDREFAFWAMVFAMPFLTLGIAAGVWWVRRK